MSEYDNIQAAIDAGLLNQHPHKLTPGHYYLVATPDGPVHVDLTGDAWLTQPRRKTGTIAVQDVNSFAAYWARHADENLSEIYADAQKRTVTAIIDAHHPGIDGSAGWRGHRLVYTARYSEAFTAWLSHTGKEMSQEQFAEFVEDNRADIHSPDAASMLEIAQTLEGHTKAAWSGGVRLANGQRKFLWSEEVEGRAGSRGELEIPTELVLQMPVFERAMHADELTARFRYRLASGRLVLLYKLDRPTEVVLAAFEDVVTQVQEATGATVMRGSTG